jgi:uncharacterized OsmC-like protein
MTNRLNDVDIESVAGLAGHITETPEAAHTTWSASVRWTGGFRSEATIRDFQPTPSDEPKGLGGTDTAPNPVEQLLGALGNCLAVGYAANATARGIAINDLSIRLDGDLDLQSFLGLVPGHAGFHDIRAIVDIDSSASLEELEDLHRHVLETSPVGHTLKASVPVSIHLSAPAAV